MIADVTLPTRTFLEEWSDSVPIAPPAGKRVLNICQPVIDPRYIQTSDSDAPWMDTRPVIEIVQEITRRLTGVASEIPSRSLVADNLRAAGQHDIDSVASMGFVASPASSTSINSAPRSVSQPSPAVATEGAFQLLPYLDIYRYDGRHANLPWLQEIPSPMTAAVWNSWAEINAAVAHELGIRTGDIVRVTSQHGSVDVAAIPSQAIHPSAIAIPIGQGHGEFGPTARRGCNPLAILDPIGDGSTGSLAYCATAVTLTKMASAMPGYNPDQGTLVLLEDRPDGREPEAIRGLIHESAREWRQRNAAES
jgi:molybdopterin-containing oxidoreductase family iron-sulfur binding subunit